MSQEHAVLTAASEEASSRYKGDWDEFNQEPVDDASCTKVTNAPIGWRRVTPAVSSGAGHWHAPYLPANVLYEAAS